MTLEEKLKVCSICKNRKHSIKEGLVCGKKRTSVGWQILFSRKYDYLYIPLSIVGIIVNLT